MSSVPLQQSLADLDRAYRKFFDWTASGRKGRRVGPPRFKKRSHRQSARFTRNAGFRVRESTHEVGFVSLPKIGSVRYKSSRSLPSDPSSVTLIREADGRYYVSFVVDVSGQATPSPAGPPTTVAGVDLALADLAAIARSDGTREKITNPRWLRARERRLARAHRALSRKRKGSANRDKARHVVAVQHRKVREARLDHHHKLALRLVRENQAVAIEGLSVAGLARTRMGKSIHDAGWSILTRLLREKAVALGREVRVINRFEPTSQVCSVCGVKGALRGSW